MERFGAFLVARARRLLLVALLGRWNRWAPPPLRRLHARLGLREAAA